MINTPLRLIILIGFLWITPLALAIAQAPDVNASVPPAKQEFPDPQQLVKGITDNVLARLQTQQEKMRNEPRHIYALVEQLMLPHFDFERMSRWVLGRYWNDATPVQQTRFTEEFRNLLVRTYGVALLDYTDDKIQFLPSRGDPSKGEVIVRMSITHRSNTLSIDTNLYLKDSEWKVYDVAINGVSLVANYRNSFAAEIRKNGMDGLISLLSGRNQGKSG